MTFLIRPARDEDLQALYEMAKLTGGGFTNLPPDRDSLRGKLDRSHACFDRVEDSVADELFVLVLENAETGEVREAGSASGKKVQVVLTVLVRPTSTPSRMPSPSVSRRPGSVLSFWVP